MTRETHFAMAFGVEAIILAEVGLRSVRIENYDEDSNIEQRMPELELVEEKWEQALIPTVAHNQVVVRYYDKKYRPRIFRTGDLVLKRVLV